MLKPIPDSAKQSSPSGALTPKRQKCQKLHEVTRPLDITARLAWKVCACWSHGSSVTLVADQWPKQPVAPICLTGATCLSHSRHALLIFFFIRGIYVCLFPFIYKSCLCPKVMTPHGGAATLTCNCITAGKADVQDHRGERGWAWLMAVSYKHAVPSRAAPPPKLCGPSLQVHSALPGKATTCLRAAQWASWGPMCPSISLLAMGWTSHCLQLRSLPGWSWPMLPDEEWAWESHSWPLAHSGIDIAP